MDSFSEPQRLDRYEYREEAMVFIRDITWKHSSPNDTEYLFAKINFRECKWLLCGTY